MSVPRRELDHIKPKSLGGSDATVNFSKFESCVTAIIVLSYNRQ